VNENAGEPTAVTQAEMAARVTAGVARPLLAGGIPGPMRLAGRWWAVREGAEDYQPVTGTVAARLDQHARRLDAATSAARRAERPE